MKKGFESTSATSSMNPVARFTSGLAAIAATSASGTALKLRSDAPFCASIRSAPPACMNSPDEPLSPPVIAPRATTVATPIAIPATVSIVLTRCRKRFLSTSVARDIVDSVRFESHRTIGADTERSRGLSADARLSLAVRVAPIS
jgi:hypothetical protein